jgi:hypothetical protein
MSLKRPRSENPVEDNSNAIRRKLEMGLETERNDSHYAVHPSSDSGEFSLISSERDVFADDPHLPSNVTFPNSASVPPRVSPERDTSTDDDHKALDAKILKGFSAFRRHNEEPELPELLSRISMDKRLTTLTTDDAEELLNNEPSIEAVLRDAWQAGSFKEVRRLGTSPIFGMSTCQLNVN